MVYLLLLLKKVFYKGSHHSDQGDIFEHIEHLREDLQSRPTLSKIKSAFDSAIKRMRASEEPETLSLVSNELNDLMRDDVHPHAQTNPLPTPNKIVNIVPGRYSTTKGKLKPQGPFKKYI